MKHKHNRLHQSNEKVCKYFYMVIFTISPEDFDISAKTKCY
jgi:hypothetical protein